MSLTCTTTTPTHALWSPDASPCQRKHQVLSSLHTMSKGTHTYTQRQKTQWTTREHNDTLLQLFTIFEKPKHRAKARADDRNPPSQDCSPHPAEKQNRSKTTNKTDNAKNGEIISKKPNCTPSKKESHTASFRFPDSWTRGTACSQLSTLLGLRSTLNNSCL